MVGAVLTQAASWTNVEMAIASLKAAGVLSPGAIREIDQGELARLVYSSSYYNAKARKLKALADFLGERYGDDVEAMRAADAEAPREELLGPPAGGKGICLLFPRGKDRLDTSIVMWEREDDNSVAMLVGLPLLSAQPSPLLDDVGRPKCGKLNTPYLPMTRRYPNWRQSGSCRGGLEG